MGVGEEGAGVERTPQKTSGSTTAALRTKLAYGKAVFVNFSVYQGIFTDFEHY